MNTLKILFLGLLVVSYHTQSFARDVFGTDNLFVKVTQNADHSMVKFELCSLVEQNNCEQIGAREFYSKKELIELRKSEKNDVWLAAGADVAIVLGCLFTGGYAGVVGSSAMASGDMMMGIEIFGALGGAAVGGGVAGGTISLVNAVNPIEQNKQLETLDLAVISDQKVTKKYPIADFAKRLKAVLDNLK